MHEPVLIQPDELQRLLGGDTPPLLVDVRYVLGRPSQRPAYEAEHLPGAHFVDLETELSGPPGDGGRHPLPDAEVFSAAMRRIGLEPGRLVVAYDAATSLSAARLWWLLTDAGHAEVRVLDGGLAGWVAGGRPTTDGPSPTVAPGHFQSRPGRRRQVDADRILRALAAGNGPTLVDVRAPERFAGEQEPIDPIAGHIPGAINRPSIGNHEPDGRFRSAEAIRERFAGLGDDAVLYCGSGITAAQTLLALESAGRTAAIYPGSWSDWITDPERPIALGPHG